MKVEVFISSLENTIQDINENTQKYHNLTVINQLPNKLNNKVQKETINGLTWIDIDQKGLSKSRNLALELADDGIVYLTDDEIELKDNFEQIITEAFLNNPGYDILAFGFERDDQTTKGKQTKEKDINYITSMKLSSVQLVFKLAFLKEHQLHYDERFGAGAKYSMGEENIILIDALKKGAKIKYIPKTIIKLHMGESTWFKGFNKKYLFDRGATFWRMFNCFAPLIALVYCVRKRNLYKENFGMFNAFKYSLNGMKDFVNNN